MEDEQFMTMLKQKELIVWDQLKIINWSYFNITVKQLCKKKKGQIKA